LNREILRLAIPNIVSNISIPLLGIVDTALMGREVDSAYIGAIALGGVIFNILYWGFGFLRPGITGLTAQAFGSKDINKCYEYFLQAFSISLIFGLGLLFFGKSIANFSYSLMNGSDMLKALSKEYFSIRILAAPAVIALFAFKGWFFGMQNSIAPMVLTIVSNLINIVLSWYLVSFCNMDIEGVAIGTVVAQYVSLLLAFGIFFYRYRLAVFHFINRETFRLKKMKRFLTVNRDMFIRNIGMIAVFTFFTNFAAGMGNDYLAINEILLQLFYFMSYSVDGFAYAAESLVGRFIGEAKGEWVLKVVKRSLLFGFAFGMAFAIAYILLGPMFIRIFTTNTTLIEEGSKFILPLAFVCIAGSFAFIWDGIFSGATASKELRNSMLLSTAMFFVGFAIFKELWPEFAIWIAMILFMSSRSIYQWLFFKKMDLLQ